MVNSPPGCSYWPGGFAAPETPHGVPRGRLYIGGRGCDVIRVGDARSRLCSPSTTPETHDLLAGCCYRTAVYSDIIPISTCRSTCEKPASFRAPRMTSGGTQFS